MSSQNTLDLKITGMSCAACVGRVEKVISRVSGVRTVAVNLGTERAHIELTDTDDRREEIIRAVSRAGFGATPIGDAVPLDEQARQDARAQETEVLMFIIAAVLTVPLLWDMIGHLTGLPDLVPPVWQLALGSALQFIPGLRFYNGAWKALKAGYGTMDTLVALGTSAAYGLSVWRVVQGQSHEGLYFESAAVVITLVLLGKILEGRARRVAASAVRALMSLRPDLAHRVLGDGTVEDVPSASLAPGDIVLVRSGELIPADGDIVDGRAAIDESLLTGESIPVVRDIGGRVIGGSLVADGPLHIRLRATGSETMLARMIRLVESAQAAKAPVQRLVDKIASVFVPVVVVIAGVTFLAWWLGAGDQTTAFRAAVSVLIIACPCALGLATPTAIMVGAGVAARRGILIRDGEAMERLGKIDTVVFDKTGTLTVGRPALVRVVNAADPGSDDDQSTLVRIAAAIQQNANHPLARALRDAAADRGLELPRVTDFQSAPGLGVTGLVMGQRFWLGSRPYMTGIGAETTALDDIATGIEDLGCSCVWMAARRDTTPDEPPLVLALFALADPARDTAAPVIAHLQRMGLHTVMLTGDSQRVADAIGEKLGLKDRRAGVPPEEKARIVAALRADGRVVAMVGDGVNDTPALAEADVGIAMGTGSDAAMETASLTLMRGNPVLIPQAIKLSKATVHRIRVNLFWAFGYNVIAIPLAAAGVLSPMIAGLAMAFSSVSVVLSSLRLHKWQPDPL